MTSTPALLVEDRPLPGGPLSAGDAGSLIRVITLNRPERRNALSPALLSAIAGALPQRAAGPDQAIRAVVLTGAGRCFSAGFDFAFLTDDERARGVDPITATADAVAACPVPVIAAVHGSAHGGAVELLAACPIRIAAPDVIVAVPAVKLGLVYPAGGLRLFHRLLGPWAARFLLVGDPIAADVAAKAGLFTDIADDPFAGALRLAAIIGGNGPLAITGTLEALRRLNGGDVDDDAIDACRAAALGSHDLLEGIDAAKKKRPPNFGGR